MSLNWKEIDRCLGELDAEGAFVQGVVQPSFDTLVLELYKPGKAFRLFTALAPGACRIHESRRGFKKPEKPLRLQELLKARILGMRVERIAQIGTERIVKIELAGTEGSLDLFIKLWSNAANVVLAEKDGTIVDAASRRPKRGEMPGQRFDPEREFALRPPTDRPEKQFEIRDLPGEGTFSERIEAWYAEHEGSLSLEALRDRAKAYFAVRASRIEAAIKALSAKQEEYARAETLKEHADIIMANLHGSPSGHWLEAEDFYHGNAPVSIRIDPEKPLKASAEDYYARYKKAKSGLYEIGEELTSQTKALADVHASETAAMALQDPFALLRLLKKHSPSKKPEDGKKTPGLEFESAGWRILVGKSAAENDELLRRHVKGNDLWLHTRDVPGGYVFVKAKAGKSVPLEVLVDAGNLAVFYSKARNSGEADLYYTQAKHLRRAKDGPKGLVLPTHEKNLRVRIDPERIKRLKPDRE